MKIVKKLVVSCLLGGMLSVADGAIAPRTEEELYASTELKVTGKVTAAEVSTEGSPMSSNWVVVLQAELDAVEKGDQVVRGETITVRCWQVKRRPSGWAGPSGHDDIPAEGSRVRLWLRSGEDGVWRPLQPNGIELLDGSPRMDFSEARAASGRRMAKIALAVAAGVLVLVLVLRMVTSSKSGSTARG